MKANNIVIHMDYLLTIQIGSVQSFISAARKTRDMWAGSFLLSYIMASMVSCVEKHASKNISMIFPHIQSKEEENSIMDFFRDNSTLSKKSLIPSLPNKILLKVGEQIDIEELVDEMERSAKDLLADIAKNVSDYCNCGIPCIDEKKFMSQVNSFLDFYWAATPIEEGNFSDAYNKVNSLVAAVKNSRLFSQNSNISSWKYGTDRNKDVLDGVSETVVTNFAELRRKQHDDSDKDEFMGAMTLIKRFFPEAYLEKFKGRGLNVVNNIPAANTYGISGEDNYYAILAFDGDEMGQWLSGAKLKNKAIDKEYIRDFSANLTKFTKDVPKKLDKKSELIYAGGDDVLAFLPVGDAINCARELHDCFAELELDGLYFKASCGISIGHKKSPMRGIKEASASAEKLAKGTYGRNALGIVIYKRSGEIVEWGCPFSAKKTWAFFDKLSSAIKKDVGNRVPYDMMRTILSYETNGLETDNKFVEELPGIMKADFTSVLAGKNIDCDKELRSLFSEAIPLAGGRRETIQDCDEELRSLFSEAIAELKTNEYPFCEGVQLASYIGDLFRVVAWISKACRE